MRVPWIFDREERGYRSSCKGSIFLSLPFFFLLIVLDSLPAIEIVGNSMNHETSVRPKFFPHFSGHRLYRLWRLILEIGPPSLSLSLSLSAWLPATGQWPKIMKKGDGSAVFREIFFKKRRKACRSNLVAG